MNDELVPITNFGRDHWSTLAYVECVITECAGFEVGYDARMRQNRRNFRVMSEECPRPRRASGPGRGIPMDPAHSTVLKDGAKPLGHDDWSCVQDMAAEGFFIDNPDVQPGVVLRLSPRGRALAESLRRWKGNGGNFASFTPEG